MLTKTLRAAASVALAITGIALAAHETPDQRVRIKKIAACIIRKNSDEADKLVNSVPGSTEENRIIQQLTDKLGNCGLSKNTLTTTSALRLRGDIAESLWVSSAFGFNSAGDARPTDNIKFTNGFLDDADLPPAYSTALCVVYRQAGGVDDLLRTLPGSAAEKKALASLTPSLSACLANGQTFTLSIPDIRAILAQQMLRRYRPSNVETVVDKYEPSIAISQRGDPGPVLSVDRFIELGAAAIKGIFAPLEAVITWDNGISSGSVRAFGHQAQPGWWTCGRVSIRRKKITETREFLVVVRDNAVRYDAVGSPIGIRDFIALSCGEAKRRGWMPVSGTIARAQPSMIPGDPALPGQ